MRLKFTYWKTDDENNLAHSPKVDLEMSYISAKGGSKPWKSNHSFLPPPPGRPWAGHKHVVNSF